MRRSPTLAKQNLTKPSLLSETNHSPTPPGFCAHCATKEHHRGAGEVVADWYYYLEERLVFPFRARCTAPLFPHLARQGQHFEVTGLAPEDVCTRDMRVVMRMHGTKVIVPLAHIVVTEAFGETIEAVAKWKRWVMSGQRF